MSKIRQALSAPLFSFGIAPALIVWGLMPASAAYYFG